MFVIHAISNTNGNNYAEVIGNQLKFFSVGGYFQIRNSPNVGIYKISAVEFVNGYTRLTATTPLPSTSLAGTLNGGVYQVDFSDASLPGKVPVIIAPATYNTTATSITLPSRGAYDYGERLVENAVHVLENFASKIPPVNPTVGQQWFDYNTQTMKRWVGDRWSSDIHINDGKLTLTDAQNNNTKVVLTASESADKAATGMTVYPEAEVASGQPIFRILNASGDVHLAVLRTDAVVTDTRFVSTSANTNEFKGKVAISSPTAAFSTGSKLNVNGNVDVVGTVIFDEIADQHGLVYRASGSNLKTIDKLWTVKSSHTDSMSFNNGSQQVALIGEINKFFTPVEMSSTLKVTGTSTFTDVNTTGLTTAKAIKVETLEAKTLTVPQSLVVNSAGTTLQKQLDVNGQIVTGLIAPTVDSQATNKKYVDDLNFLSMQRDVNIPTPADTQSLTYDGLSKRWIARTLNADNISGLEVRIKDKAAESVIQGTHLGITPTYNNTAKTLSFAMNAHTLNASGDATGTVSVDWTGATTLPLTLKASGVVAGQYTKLTVNAKGIVTAGTTLVPNDIPTLDPSKIVGNYNLQNQYKVSNAVDPTDAGDYVTLRYLQNYTFDAGTF